MGGKIDVVSKLGVGSIFTIDIPYHPCQAPTPPISHKIQSLDPIPIKILLAEVKNYEKNI